MYCIIISGIICMSLLASCSITNTAKIKKWLMIGEGGGITGAYTHFYMLPNGEIYRREQFDSIYIHLNPMPGRIACGYFRDLPYNLFKSIVWCNKGLEKTFTWIYSKQCSEKADVFCNFLLGEMYKYNPTASR